MLLLIICIFRTISHDDLIELIAPTSEQGEHLMKSYVGARSQFAPIQRDTQWGLMVELVTPVIDGEEFADQPIHLFETGQWNTDKDVIIGHTNGEMNVYEMLGNALTRERLNVSCNIYVTYCQCVCKVARGTKNYF